MALGKDYLELTSTLGDDYLSLVNQQSTSVSQPMQAGAENPYTRLEKAATFATPLALNILATGKGIGVGSAIGTAIAPGIGTAIGGFAGGLIAGTTAAFGGKILADSMEAMFGGEQRTQEQTMERAKKYAKSDAIWYSALSIPGPVLKATGLDKPIKKVVSTAFKPIADIVKKTAQPVVERREILSSLKKLEKQQVAIDGLIKQIGKRKGSVAGEVADQISALKKEQQILKETITQVKQSGLPLGEQIEGLTQHGESLRRSVDDILSNSTVKAINAVKLGLRDAGTEIGNYEKAIRGNVEKLAPFMDVKLKESRELLSNIYDDILKTNGGNPVNINMDDIIKKLNEADIDSNVREAILGKIQLTAPNAVEFGIPKKIDAQLDSFKKAIRASERGRGVPDAVVDGMVAQEKARLMALPENLATKPQKVFAVEAVDSIRRNMDDTIQRVLRGDTEGMSNIDQIWKIRDSVVEALELATKGKTSVSYKRASSLYKEQIRVEGLIDGILGKQGTGWLPMQRGKDIGKEVARIANAAPGEVNFLKESREFMGKLKAQNTLFDRLGMHTDAAVMRTQFQQLTESLIKKSDYTAIESALRELNKNLTVSGKISPDDFKRIMSISGMKPKVQGKKTLQQLLSDNRSIQDIQGEIEKTARRITDLKAKHGGMLGMNTKTAIEIENLGNKIGRLELQREDLLKPIMAKLERAGDVKDIIKTRHDKLTSKLSDPMYNQFNAHTDKFIPFAMATVAKILVPSSGNAPVQAASVFTLFRLRHIGADAAIRTIDAISKKTSKIAMSQNQRIVLSKFFANIINAIEQDE